MKYIGSSTIPEEIDFDFEHLSGNTSGGNCKYSKTLGGFNIVFSNDDKLNDNIAMCQFKELYVSFIFIYSDDHTYY
jgi:hypothetical protein